MTFFRRLIMSRRWPSWKEHPELALPLLLFALLVIHGALIGLTDDEAYYWVLAQKPAMGYAYHPPAVAWSIAASQAALGWLIGSHSSAMVRVPAAAYASAVLGMSLLWLRSQGSRGPALWRGGAVLLSLAGLFGLSWMMVPDLPLLAGWTLACLSCWEWLFGGETGWPGPGLALGTCLAVISKYSGILVEASAVGAILLWARPGRKASGLGWVVFGGLVGALPPLWWNAHHQWASILYQIRDRQEGADFSLIRYLRFWLIEAVAAGPFLLAFTFATLPRALRRGVRGTEDAKELRVLRYAWLWAAPAALVFCLQPLWADFKPHWALIVWWPMALALAWCLAVANKARGFAIPQIFYGLGLSALVLLSCHFPAGDYALDAFAGPRADPKLDVTNDLYGWSGLGAFLRSQPGNAELSMPVIGSRYQTAAQAYFSLGPTARVTLLPRDLKARDEWPDLGVSRGQGPRWPELVSPVFFVADNRYDEGPLFPGASCGKIGRLKERRGPLVAKWIDVWRCEPSQSGKP